MIFFGVAVTRWSFLFFFGWRFWNGQIERKPPCCCCFLLEVIQKSNNEIALSSIDMAFRGIVYWVYTTSSMEIWELAASSLFFSAQLAVHPSSVAVFLECSDVNTAAVPLIEEAESIPIGWSKAATLGCTKTLRIRWIFPHDFKLYLSTGCMDFQSESAVVAPIAFRCSSDRSLSTVLGELLPSTSLLLDCGIMLSLQRCQVWSVAR